MEISDPNLKMEKMLMCRICLAENVRMHLVIDTKIHEFYERMTDIPFVTEDSRPMLACFICYAKLKQCCQLQKKCLEADQLFTQIINQPNFTPLLNRGQLQLFNGLIKTPVEHTNVVGRPDDKFTVKQEIPVDFEKPVGIIVPKQEILSDDDNPKNAHNPFSDIEHLPANHSKPDSDVSPMKIEIEVELEREGMNNRSVIDMQYYYSGTTGQYPQPNMQRPDLDVISGEHKENEDFISQTHTKPRNTGVGRGRGRRSNPGEKSFRCTICERHFTKNIYLTRHIRTHNGEKRFKCEVCERSFTRKEHLINHARLHTGEKPFQCLICERRFNRKELLNSHIRMHNGEKRYKCHVCQHSFNRKVHLTHHIRVHTGEKPFQCDICHRSFIRKDVLKDHIQTHTRESRFKCFVCERTFCRKGHLENHFRLHTGEQSSSLVN